MPGRPGFASSHALDRKWVALQPPTPTRIREAWTALHKARKRLQLGGTATQRFVGHRPGQDVRLDEAKVEGSSPQRSGT